MNNNNANNLSDNSYNDENSTDEDMFEGGLAARIRDYEETGRIPVREDILLEIGKFAHESGYRVHVVGGYVRDYFLGRPRHDLDCTVEGDAIEFALQLAARFNTKAIIYERFRTALVPIGGYHCEFVGTRREVYEEDSRKPIVSEGTLEDDIKRRDFTINSMAACLNPDNTGEVTDLFDGIESLKKGILKTPLDPEITYSDDPLRMMRAARFAAQLDFMIEEKSFDAIKKMASRISIISQERISDELLKIISSPNPSKGFYVLYFTGLLELVFPELYHLAGVEIVQEGDREYGHKDVFRHTLKVLDNLSQVSDNPWLRFAALVHDIAKPQTKRFSEGAGWTFHGHEEMGARKMRGIFKRLKLPMDYLPYVEKLVRLHQRPMALVDDGVTDSAVRRLAVKAGSALEDLFALCRADITTRNQDKNARYLNNYDVVAQKVMDVQEKDKLREFQSPVRGEEIMEICGLQPSKPVGIIKTNIEEAILEGIIPNEYEEARAYFLEHKDEWISELREEGLIPEMNS